jgi:hypothetical protein
MKKIYKNISALLSELCLDRRVDDGIFDIFNNDHMEILREKFSEMGIPKGEVVEYANKVIEGKYPERQAYNSKGILVTFPNPEYKQRALKRRTHFEEDPTKGQTNLDFNAPAQPVQEPTSPNEKPIEIEPGAQQPNQQVQGQDPMQGGSSAGSQTGSSAGSQSDDLATRSPDQKEKDAAEIEKILTMEFTLEEATSNNWIRNKNRWYNVDGQLVGCEWYNVNSHKTTILSVR